MEMKCNYLSRRKERKKTIQREMKCIYTYSWAFVFFLGVRSFIVIHILNHQ